MSEPSGVRNLGNAFAIAEDASQRDSRGSVWKLTDQDRELDSNIVRIAPGDSIGPHDGPNLDVMIFVLTGAAAFTSDGPPPVTLSPGDVLWLPQHSRRTFAAGLTGVTYLTVHRRRPKLSITTTGR